MPRCEHEWTCPTYEGTYEPAHREPEHEEKIWGAYSLVPARDVPAHYTHLWRRRCKRCDARQEACNFRARDYPAPPGADWLIRAAWTKTPENALDLMRESGWNICWYDLQQVWIPASEASP